MLGWPVVYKVERIYYHAQRRAQYLPHIFGGLARPCCRLLVLFACPGPRFLALTYLVTELALYCMVEVNGTCNEIKNKKSPYGTDNKDDAPTTVEEKRGSPRSTSRPRQVNTAVTRTLPARVLLSPNPQPTLESPIGEDCSADGPCSCWEETSCAPPASSRLSR